MYTSIPTQDAITITTDYYYEHYIKEKPLKNEHLKTILNTIINNNIFTFNNKIYRQVKGLQMGNPISRFIAILYLDRIERQVLSTTQYILYARYVDDTIIITEK